MRTPLLVAATLFGQLLLGCPGVPALLGDINLPVVWIVGPTMLRYERGWPYLALAIGLTWDIVLAEDLVGPGGIAWSASALICSLLAGLVADRSPRAWFFFGAVATATIIIVRQLALLPLGRASWAWLYVARSMLLSAGWCGLVGFTLSLGLPQRWQRYRSRRLR